MLVAFLVLHGFGQRGENLTWEDFTYNSPEEKAFWDKLEEWRIYPSGNKKRNSLGDEIDKNSTNGFLNYSST